MDVIHNLLLEWLEGTSHIGTLSIGIIFLDFLHLLWELQKVVFLHRVQPLSIFQSLLEDIILTGALVFGVWRNVDFGNKRIEVFEWIFRSPDANEFFQAPNIFLFGLLQDIGSRFAFEFVLQEVREIGIGPQFIFIFFIGPFLLEPLYEGILLFLEFIFNFRYLSVVVKILLRLSKLGIWLLAATPLG